MKTKHLLVAVGIGTIAYILAKKQGAIGGLGEDYAQTFLRRAQGIPDPVTEVPTKPSDYPISILVAGKGWWGVKPTYSLSGLLGLGAGFSNLVANMSAQVANAAKTAVIAPAPAQSAPASPGTQTGWLVDWFPDAANTNPLDARAQDKLPASTTEAEIRDFLTGKSPSTLETPKAPEQAPTPTTSSVPSYSDTMPGAHETTAPAGYWESIVTTYMTNHPGITREQAISEITKLNMNAQIAVLAYAPASQTQNAPVVAQTSQVQVQTPSTLVPALPSPVQVLPSPTMAPVTTVPAPSTPSPAPIEQKTGVGTVLAVGAGLLASLFLLRK
jgi:hypothetical protein